MSTTFIVDPILPAERLHLVGGPVGVGKTTFVFQMLNAIAASQPFLDWPTHKIPIAYFAADRSRAENIAMLDRLGLLESLQMEIHPLDELQEIPTLENLLDHSAGHDRLVVVEPLYAFLRDERGRSGNPNDVVCVSNFLLRARRSLLARRNTMIATMHTPKMHGENGYLLEREKITGSAAWSAFASTVITISADDPGNPSDALRKVCIMPRESRAIQMEFVLDDAGRFTQAKILDAMTEDKFGPAFTLLDGQLEVYPHDAEFERLTVMGWCLLFKLAPVTGDRWIRRSVREQKIERVRRGVYRRATVQ